MYKIDKEAEDVVIHSVFIRVVSLSYSTQYAVLYSVWCIILIKINTRYVERVMLHHLETVTSPRYPQVNYFTFLLEKDEMCYVQAKQLYLQKKCCFAEKMLLSQEES